MKNIVGNILLDRIIRIFMNLNKRFLIILVFQFICYAANVMAVDRNIPNGRNLLNFAGRHIDEYMQGQADNYRLRRVNAALQKADLEREERQLTREVEARPGDEDRRARLNRLRARIQDMEEEAQRAQRRIDAVDDVALDLVQDATKAFIIEPMRAREERERALLTAAAQQKMANVGALERLRHMTSQENITRLSLAVGGVGAALIAAYFVAKFGLYYAQRFVGLPKLVRESSEKNLWQSFVSLFSSEEKAVNFLNDVILSPDNMAIINELAMAAEGTKKDGLPFRNVLLYGEPGTGKTMIAKRIARYCGMDYAILSGADFMQFEEGKDIEQLHKLFDRAEQSKKGMVIFIDEADAALRDRKDQDNRGKALVDAFLARTGDKSKQFMIILATNHPQDLDPAVLSRISKKVHVALPELPERVKILQLYLSKYFVEKPTVLDGEQVMLAPQLDEEELKEVASNLTAWSGRELEDLIGELRYVLSSQNSRLVTKDIIKSAADEKLKQRKAIADYDGHTAAHAAAVAA
ncbi:AAA family ATPase [Candidatus Dependentiae bacterium]|nr:AAA family ATPase [Candidatus Dependentiae bacterium]